MDFINWMGVVVGIVVMVGAWTNWLNYRSDGKDSGNELHPAGWFIFTFICLRKRKAYRVFLWILGITITLLSIYSSPAVRAYFQSST